MTPKQICTGCQKLKKIILSYEAEIEINGNMTVKKVRLCRDCLVKQAEKPKK